jgi:hypothetical protein
MRTYRTPRCISISDEGRRCPHKVVKRSEDLYLCHQHSTLITLLLTGDQYSYKTRRLLAMTRWETAAEGQALIDRAPHIVALGAAR